MRSSSLLAIAVIAVACLSLPVAVSGSANFTLFADSACTSSLGPQSTAPWPSSPSCQSFPGTQYASFTLVCAQKAVNTTFTFAVWAITDSCSGQALFAIAADGPTGSCEPATLTVLGKAAPVYALVQCSDSDDGEVEQKEVRRQTDVDRVERSIGELIENVREYTARTVPAQADQPTKRSSAMQLLVDRIRGKQD